MVRNSFIQSVLKNGNQAKVEVFLSKLSMDCLLSYDKSCYRMIIQYLFKTRLTVGFQNMFLKGITCKKPLFLTKTQQASKSFKRLAYLSHHTTTPIFTDFVMKELLCDQRKEFLLKRKQIFKVANQNKLFANFR